MEHSDYHKIWRAAAIKRSAMPSPIASINLSRADGRRML